MLVLASASPRRAEILRNAGLDFKILPAASEINPDPELPPEIYASESAVNKARAVAALCGGDDTVLAADTVVCLDGIIGKPKDAKDAFAILKRLSGRTHSVVTGYAVMRGGKTVTGYEKTQVTFRELSDGEIEEYIATGEPMDKAGAYGIQGLAGAFVEKVEGDMNNVIGLPDRAVAVALHIERNGAGDIPDRR